MTTAYETESPVPERSGLLDEARAGLERTIDFRRRLHRRPELGLTLPLTQEAVLVELADLGLEIRTGTEVSSVVAVLRGARPGPTYLLRGDMDALPLTEDTGLDFASEIPGVMHACGHDTHVAMLAGAAHVLAARRDALAGQVVFMFQPGEEGHHGAEHMLADGLLDSVPEAPVSGGFALHTTALFPTGTINTRPGPLLASDDTIEIVVSGRGGHASAPHDALDPVPVACEIALAVQTMVTRRVSVFDPAVVTIASIQAGTTHNVIPPLATLRGTMRTLSAQTRETVRDLVGQVARGVAAAHGAEVRVTLDAGYPVTVNDVAAAGRVDRVAAATLGAEAVAPMATPIMGAEDWSYVLERIPGSMAFLGARPPEMAAEDALPNHSNLVVFDEPAMAAGVAMYSAMAIDALSRSTGPA